MARPLSMDLRERVVDAVVREGMSCRQAAARFGIGVSTSIGWVTVYRKTGSVAPGQMGGHRPKKLIGPWREWLVARCRERDFTLRGARRARDAGRLQDGVGVRARREADA